MKPYYTDKYCTIYHGDCLEIMPELESVDLVLTDPVYKNENTNYASRNRGKRLLKGIITEPKDWGIIHGSDIDFDPNPFLDFKEVILFGGNYFSNKLPPSPKWIIWDKRNGVTPDDNADCEMAWTNLKGVSRIHYQLWKGICRKGRENIAIQGDKLHPFQKPIELMKFCLNESKTKGTVLDPFMGSGTTLVAAKELGRKAIGIEIEEKYCEIAVKRLQQEVIEFPSQESTNQETQEKIF